MDGGIVMGNFRPAGRLRQRHIDPQLGVSLSVDQVTAYQKPVE